MKNFPKIKICGIKTADMAYHVSQLGVNYIGIIQHPPSRRHVSIETAKEIAIASRAGGAEPVAVCVNQTPDEIKSFTQATNINMVQLHGKLARDASIYLPKSLRKIYVREVNALGEIMTHSPHLEPNFSSEKDYILFDGLQGGSGKPILTHQVEQASNGLKYFIAGGVNKNNIADILKAHPLCYGIDVSSSIEDKHGEKNLSKIKQFITTVNEAYYGN